MRFCRTNSNARNTSLNCECENRSLTHVLYVSHYILYLIIVSCMYIILGVYSILGFKTCSHDMKRLHLTHAMFISLQLVHSMARASAAVRHRGHVCAICNKAFETRYKLERHQRTHTGEKPYACPYCPHRCNQRDNLKAHIASRHKEFYDHVSFEFK